MEISDQSSQQQLLAFFLPLPKTPFENLTDEVIHQTETRKLLV